MQQNRLNAMIVFVIVLILLVQAGFKVKVTHAVLTNKNTQPCLLLK